MAQRRFPDFYQQIAGGAVATLIAVAAAGVEIEANPSRVVTAGIVMLLAGIGVMGATQDAITGFPVTASARNVPPANCPALSPPANSTCVSPATVAIIAGEPPR